MSATEATMLVFAVFGNLFGCWVTWYYYGRNESPLKNRLSSEEMTVKYTAFLSIYAASILTNFAVIFIHSLHHHIYVSSVISANILYMILPLPFAKRDTERKELR